MPGKSRPDFFWVGEILDEEAIDEETKDGSLEEF